MTAPLIISMISNLINLSAAPHVLRPVSGVPVSPLRSEVMTGGERDEEGGETGQMGSVRTRIA